MFFYPLFQGARRVRHPVRPRPGQAAGGEEVPGDLRQQAPGQDQPGRVRPGDPVRRRRLPHPARGAAGGVLRPALRLPPHPAGERVSRAGGVVEAVKKLPVHADFYIASQRPHFVVFLVVGKLDNLRYILFLGEQQTRQFT